MRLRAVLTLLLGFAIGIGVSVGPTLLPFFRRTAVTAFPRPRDAGPSRAVTARETTPRTTDPATEMEVTADLVVDAEGRPDGDLDADDLFQEVALSRDSIRPIPAEMERLSEGALQDIRAYRDTMPLRLNVHLVDSGDVESLLEDPTWNPDGRTVDQAARDELARIMSEYRYFSRIAPLERVAQGIKPVLPSLRAAGRYLEYPMTEAPPAIEGVAISHAETSDTPGYYRIYYFVRQDYPELYHHYNVSHEQQLRIPVNIFRVIQGEEPF